MFGVEIDEVMLISSTIRHETVTCMRLDENEKVMVDKLVET